MTTITPAPPSGRKPPQALTKAATLAALLGAAALGAPSAHALSGTAQLAPGTTYTAPAGTNFSLDFSGIFTDTANMGDGNYWEFNIVQTAGNASFTNLGWEISTDNGSNWSPVDWQNLDPMGPSGATTNPTRDGSGNFTASSNTIDLGLGSVGTSLTSAYLQKSTYAGVTNVRIVGDVNTASTPYKTKFSISDVIWDGSSTNTPVDNNAYQANLANVPGPLPLVGAALGLGFSRRLKRRMKTVAG